MSSHQTNKSYVISLRFLGVDRHIRIGEEHFQTQPALARIGQCLGEWIAGQQTLALELALDPVEEPLHLRTEALAAMQALS